MPVDVPAGTYLVTLTADVVVNDETSASLVCYIHYSSTLAPASAVLDESVDQDLIYQSGSAEDVATFSVPTTISVDCLTNTGNTGGTAGLFAGSLTAVTIGVNHAAG